MFPSIFFNLLQTGAFLDWSLISLVDLLAFLFIQFSAPKIGKPFHFLLSIIVFFFVVVVVVVVIIIIIIIITVIILIVFLCGW